MLLAPHLDGKEDGEEASKQRGRYGRRAESRRVAPECDVLRGLGHRHVHTPHRMMHSAQHVARPSSQD